MDMQDTINKLSTEANRLDDEATRAEQHAERLGERAHEVERAGAPEQELDAAIDATNAAKRAADLLRERHRLIASAVSALEDAQELWRQGVGS